MPRLVAPSMVPPRRKIPRTERKKIEQALARFVASYPRGDFRKLTDSGLWRLRVGRWRVLFEPNPTTKTIVVRHVRARDKASR